MKLSAQFRKSIALQNQLQGLLLSKLPIQDDRICAGLRQCLQSQLGTDPPEGMRSHKDTPKPHDNHHSSDSAELIAELLPAEGLPASDFDLKEQQDLLEKATIGLKRLFLRLLRQVFYLSR